MSRNITVISTQISSKKTISSAASTWGELKSVLVNQDLYTSGMKAMEKETKATYEHDSASLPSGDFILFLTPGKMKSGK